jgi:hypothetical protein
VLRCSTTLTLLTMLSSFRIGLRNGPTRYESKSVVSPGGVDQRNRTCSTAPSSSSPRETSKANY